MTDEKMLIKQALQLLRQPWAGHAELIANHDKAIALLAAAVRLSGENK